MTNTSGHGPQTKRLWSYGKPYAGWMLLGASCSVIIGLCEIFTAALIKRVIDETLLANKEVILFSLLLMVAVVAAGMTAKYLEPYCSGRFGSRVIRDVRSDLTRHMNCVQVLARDKIHSGDLTSRLNSDLSALERFIGSFPAYIYRPTIILVICGYLVTVHWSLLLVSILPIPVALYLANRAGKSIGMIRREYHQRLGGANSIVQDVLSGIGLVKAYNLQDHFLDKNRKEHAEALTVYEKVNRRDMLMMPLMFMIYELPYVLCMLYGGYLAVYQGLAPGSLIVFVLLLASLIGPASQLPNMIMEAKGIAGVNRRLLELLELSVEEIDGASTGISGNEMAIEFEGVGFSYIEKETVLQDISFQVKPGETVAIVGASGCGKSTILSLLCGFYPPGSGAVLVFGRKVEAWNLHALRDNLAVVIQDTYLFTGTVEENIRVAKPDCPDEELIEAAQAADAHEFIMGFPEGYQYQVGEDGIQLSGGQRQRIALARAILKGSPILLLDEPTAVLDSQSEHFLQKSLEKLNNRRTLVIVTHRLSTIQHADQILVMEGGKIAERGTHAELMSKGGLYRQLVRAQESAWEGKDSKYA